jgi:hypothetical protein
MQAGLERLVRTAGLEVAANGDVPVVLRTRDQAWEGGGVDVVVDGGRLSVTMDAAPDPDTWLSVLSLFRTLLDPRPVSVGSGTRLSPGPAPTRP